ncbi:hypothetical protein [Leptospira harrisiae]|uniref:OmpA-like domain-containing protein n=1 Tax=Leptospira harrisiae TaxID=2023189 RepID=A0A2N0AMV4_9LEPT|nr:hypothetical protein [Leptospira harrisiae]PJZ85560.1 hypothetical protein CH364_04920 [Leptospira harrisiae]PKA09096.1 hypothetical protein CH366_05060 [Leptospira harrisiae]
MWKCKWIFLFLIPQFLSAEGFQKGNLMLFGSGSYGLGMSSGSLERYTETYNFPSYLFLRDSLSPEARNFYFYALNEFNSDQVQLNSHLGEVGIQYALFKFLSVGLTGVYQSIEASNLRQLEPTFVLLAANQLQRQYPSNSYNDSLSSAELLSFLIRKDQRISSITTGNLDFGIHFLPNSVFDPYIRFGGGIGNERQSGGNVQRFFAGLGLRFHFASYFLFLEALTTNTYIVDYKAQVNTFRNRGNFEENFVSLGFGKQFSIGSSHEEPSGSTVVQTLDKTQLAEPPPRIKTFSLLASEIFEPKSTRIHVEGRAKLDALARSFAIEYPEYEIVIINYVAPFPGAEEDDPLQEQFGINRSFAIFQILREKNIPASRIVNATAGSTRYELDSSERVLFELRAK